MVTIKFADSDYELLQIIELQTLNHVSNVSLDCQLESGFVTVKNTIQELKIMNKSFRQIIAVAQGNVVAYALIISKELKSLIPTLAPMFEMLDSTQYKGVIISNLNYYVMGQICIKEDFRGKGLFYKLYNEHKTKLASTFDCCITEVATRNIRSMSAHRKMGFQLLKTYKDQNEEWGILIWDWR